MQDQDAAWIQLSRDESISPQQSEAFLDALLEERVLKPSSIPLAEKRVLMNLANALQRNHHDSWFKNFLDEPFSAQANRLLQSAISNRNTDAGRTLQYARAAENLYLHAGNIAGAARSQIEIVYATRRLSQSAQCVEAISRLKQRIAGLGYRSFQILADFESANCQTMRGSFDLGRQFAEQTNLEANRANYPSLKLRALGLLSTLASVEGRYQAAFNIDASGLALYWDGLYEGKRGFQFYSDAALTAEQAGFWHLAASLQNEALASLAGNELVDFQASAHYHRAISLERAGDTLAAQQEFGAAYRLFDKMRDPSFLLANSEVDLAGIEIEHGDLSSAQTHLKKASSVITRTDNFLVSLTYYNTLANLERHRNRPNGEWEFLKKSAAIANKGFTNLNSIDNRWSWYQEVDRAFHRLIELQLEAKHDPVQALADWEAYRAAELFPSRLVPENASNRVRLASYLKGMRTSTLISFIIFPEKVVVFIADDRGVADFSVLVDPETLKQESETFLRLCSDPTSSLEKVNLTGLRLYQQLLQPIRNALTPDRSLVIEADGFLSRIPWPALVAESGKYLDEEYMTVSTPGLFFRAGGSGRKQPAQDGLVVYPGAAEFEGNTYPPLPHAEEEADHVAGLQPGSKYLREEQVTARELLSRLPRSALFHFAGHGVSREHGGELLLSNKETLSASAVRRLDLSGMDLVVLSACTTADADLDIARSPNGLVQAFLSAGAQEVVASRWDAESRASYQFMEIFYNNLHGHAAGGPARIARSHVRMQSPHPYYWANFEVYGYPTEYPENVHGVYDPAK